jgi:type IV pilus assembly protein PilF
MKKFVVLIFSLFVLAACGTPRGDERYTSEQSGKPVNSSAKIHTELAALYYERSQFGVALGEIEKALKADRNHAPAYNVRGLVNMALREYKDAEEDFQQSLNLDKTDSETHNNYGWFLCQRGKEKDSIPHFMKALKNPLYGTPERAWLNAGLCSKKAGNNKDAEEFLQRALTLQPDIPQAFLAMAELSFDNGNYAMAKKYFTKFYEKSGNPSAEQLWLAVRIERKLGDRNSAGSYGMQLRNRFPDASETRLFIQGE